MTSLMSIWIMEFMTVGVIVTIPWKRKVPMITLVIEALLTDAPPIRIAETAGYSALFVAFVLQLCRLAGVGV